MCVVGMTENNKIFQGGPAEKRERERDREVKRSFIFSLTFVVVPFLMKHIVVVVIEK